MVHFQKAMKRAMDVVASALLLILLSPVLVLIAIAVWAADRGPVLFVQQRVGLEESLFPMYKFRTMVLNAERLGAGYFMDKDDPRITRVGKTLRLTSLDELPQLVNILMGHMSLIGPRPVLPYQVKEYSAEQKTRFQVRPGVTGLAQVMGRNTLPWVKRLQYDQQYVLRWSLWLDLRILWRTIFVVLKAEGIRMDQKAEDVEIFR